MLLNIGRILDVDNAVAVRVALEDAGIVAAGSGGRLSRRSRRDDRIGGIDNFAVSGGVGVGSGGVGVIGRLHKNLYGVLAQLGGSKLVGAVEGVVRRVLNAVGIGDDILVEEQIGTGLTAACLDGNDRLGVALDEVSLVGTDSIASMAQKSGLQAMHLFGAENGKPALKNSADDVLENIDELLFDDNVNFVFELLKH